MTEQEIRDEARSLKVWVFQNKTKCLIFAGIVVILDRLCQHLLF